MDSSSRSPTRSLLALWQCHPQVWLREAGDTNYSLRYPSVSLYCNNCVSNCANVCNLTVQVPSLNKGGGWRKRYLLSPSAVELQLLPQSQLNGNMNMNMNMNMSINMNMNMYNIHIDIHIIWIWIWVWIWIWICKIISAGGLYRHKLSLNWIYYYNRCLIKILIILREYQHQQFRPLQDTELR